jgi:hypothetical protein
MVLTIDPDAIVFDTKLPVAAVFASEYLDIRAFVDFLLKFEGIVYQVEQQFFDILTIRFDRRHLRRH